MKGLVFEGKQALLRSDLPRPAPAADEVLIRISLAGICATDLEIVKGYMGFEGILGHEFVGVVEAPEDDEWNGKRVVGGINCPCGRCEFCKSDMGRHCGDRSVLGILGRDGVLAEYATLPKSNLAVVPDSIPDEDAVYAEPLAAALRMIEQGVVDKTDRIAILGDGRLGLLSANALGSSGFDITLIGLDPDKMAKAPSIASKWLANEAPPASFDVAIDCTGSSTGFEEALRLLKPLGRLILKTTVADREAIDLNSLVINEITLVGSRCGRLEDAIEFLDRGAFAPSSLTSATFPLSNGLQALEAAMDPANIKVLLDCSS